jgi:transcriptional regulator with XRE-family HTH domain
MPRPCKKKPGKNETLGDRIRRYRLAKGLTQAELAKLVGASQRMINYYEVRGVSPPPELVVKIADALDVSIDELFGRKPRARRAAGVAPAGESLRRRRRLKRLDELPRDEQSAVLKMIEALAERSKRKASG